MQTVERMYWLEALNTTVESLERLLYISETVGAPSLFIVERILLDSRNCGRLYKDGPRRQWGDYVFWIQCVGLVRAITE